MKFWAIFAALLSALSYSAAFVSQQHVAERVPKGEGKGLRLYAQLMKRPIWWAGALGDVGGMVFQAVALGAGSVALAQPFLVTAMIFSLPLAARWNKRRVKRSDMIWAVVLVVALAVFTVIGNPTEPDHVKGDWLVPGIVTLGVIGLLFVFSIMQKGPGKAMGFGASTGIMYGLYGVLIDSAMHESTRSQWWGMLTHWQIYVGIAAGILGTAMQQTAFHAGSLGASLPATQVLEPLAGVVLGVIVLQARFAATGFQWVVLGAAVVVMIVGTIALSRSAARQ